MAQNMEVLDVTGERSARGRTQMQVIELSLFNISRELLEILCVEYDCLQMLYEVLLFAKTGVLGCSFPHSLRFVCGATSWPHQQTRLQAGLFHIILSLTQLQFLSLNPSLHASNSV